MTIAAALAEAHLLGWPLALGLAAFLGFVVREMAE
jgi:hypothetical protein